MMVLSTLACHINEQILCGPTSEKANKHHKPNVEFLSGKTPFWHQYREPLVPIHTGEPLVQVLAHVSVRAMGWSNSIERGLVLHSQTILLCCA